MRCSIFHRHKDDRVFFQSRRGEDSADDKLLGSWIIIGCAPGAGRSPVTPAYPRPARKVVLSPMTANQQASRAALRRLRLPIVFLGPSLPQEEALRIVKAEYRPPIRRGDLDGIPAGSIVAIIDGVFDQSLAVSATE